MRSRFAILGAALASTAGGAAPAPPLRALVVPHAHVERVVVSVDGDAWRDETPRLSGTIDDVTFVDRRRGWIAASDCAAATATLASTADGGRTWVQRPSRLTHSCNAGAGVSLDFVDTRVGWAVHDEPTAPFAELYRTTDGGSSWRLVAHRLPTLGKVAFEGREIGWLAGRGLNRTTDAGHSWHAATPAAPTRRRGDDVWFAAPAFSGSRGLVVADYRGLVAAYTTSDGGAHWHRQAVASTSDTEETTTIASTPSPDAAWIVPSARRRQVVLVTADAGRHWTRRPLPPGVSSIVGFDGRRAAVATTRGVRVTRDGGRTWR